MNQSNSYSNRVRTDCSALQTLMPFKCSVKERYLTFVIPSTPALLTVLLTGCEQDFGSFKHVAEEGLLGYLHNANAGSYVKGLRTRDTRVRFACFAADTGLLNPVANDPVADA